MRIGIVLLLPALALAQGPPRPPSPPANRTGSPPTPPVCCPKKMVDSDIYTFLEVSFETRDFDCVDPCVYNLEGTDRRFCFAPGSDNVKCVREEGTGSPSTGSPATAGPTEAPNEVVDRVKGYIDAGTCTTRVSSTGNCGDSATSFYHEMTYNGKRVIISNQVPDHDAEHDQLHVNPNTRCERWQFTQLPLQPSKGSFVATGLGTTGLAVTGGAFFNDLSSPQGDLALYNEGSSLDSCFGHSAREGSYHYHANINCTNAGAATGANNPKLCVLVGYMLDGVPVYGLCEDSTETVMKSCYKLVSGANTGTVTTVGGTYTVGITNSDYEFDQAGYAAGSCQLDEANGAVHPKTGEYSYFMTTDHPFIPIGYYGNEGKQRICSAA